MKNLPYLVSFFIFSFVVTACQKEKKFPPEPSIEFKKFTVYDSIGIVQNAECIIKFKDGDGDIGILEGDNTSMPDLTMLYLYKDNITGQFVPYDRDPGTSLFDTLSFEFRVPDITPLGQYKALEGEIKTTLPSLFYFPGHHLIKFEITLRDRAGHLSNKVTTDEINIP